MLSGLGLYFRYLGVSLRAQLQYRASLVMQSLGVLIITGIEFLGVWALFARFGHIGGWTLAEVALLYGMVEVAFAVSDTIGRGFDLFPAMVQRGDFDRLLVRPRSTILQLAGQELALKRVGRLAQGAAVLLWAVVVLDLDWSLGKLLLLLGAIAAGVCLFVGLFIVQATISFWTVEPLEIMAAFTHGGVETGHYPMTIYRGWFRHFFVFVVPLASATYLPAVAILGRTDPLGSPPLLQWLAPLGGPLFLLASFGVWNFGVRKYVSTGS